MFIWVARSFAIVVAGVLSLAFCWYGAMMYASSRWKLPCLVGILLILALPIYLVVVILPKFGRPAMWALAALSLFGSFHWVVWSFMLFTALLCQVGTVRAQSTKPALSG